jgi:subtilisin family serine protease
LSFNGQAACKNKNVVAVIDTGLDVTHPSLKDSLWINSQNKEKATNGLDDDNNGFIDDVNGWNFIQSNHNLTDDHGHGTHVSGIITSMSPKTKIMVLKYYGKEVKNPLNTTIASIHYAIKMGVCIINYSSAGMDSSPAERAALVKAKKANILFVSAAGNSAADLDDSHFYPSSYALENIISVASVDKGAKLLKSSNFGERTVTIAAEGSEIVSTFPKGIFGKLSGTSQAAAFVSGLASRILSNSKTEVDFLSLKRLLIADAQVRTDLNDKVLAQGVINKLRTHADSFIDQGRTASGLIYKNQDEAEL